MRRIIAESTLDHTAEWMRQWAEASAKGVIVTERAMDDGGWLVETRWPSQADCVANARHMWTLQAMAARIGPRAPLRALASTAAAKQGNGRRDCELARRPPFADAFVGE